MAIIDDKYNKKLLYLILNNVFLLIIINFNLVEYSGLLNDQQNYIIIFLYYVIIFILLFFFKKKYKENKFYYKKNNEIYIKFYLNKFKVYVKSNNFMSLENQNQNLNIINLNCIICYKNKSTILFDPCYHSSLCKLCFIDYINIGYNNCPICKIKINSYKLMKVKKRYEYEVIGKIFIN